MAPFLLLLFFLALLNLVPKGSRSGHPEPAAPETVPLPTTGVTPSVMEVRPTIESTPTELPTLTLTPPALQPTPSASPMPSPSPSFPPGAEIQLLGPPPESQFRDNDTISFYWIWPFELTDSHRFTLYLFWSDQRIAAGEVNQANIGRAYRMQVALPLFEEPVTNLRWQVKLEDISTSAPLIESNIRDLTLIPASG